MTCPMRSIVASLVVVLSTCVAQGGVVLTLSDLSSDETRAETLNASMTFSLSDDVLTLSVANATVDPATFDIDAVYFNVADHIDSLLLLSDDLGWSLLPNQKAGGFGQFDYALLSGRGNDPAEIAPGATLDFGLLVSAGGPIHELDFASEVSRIPPGDSPSIGAAKFVNGPRDDSAFGAVIPEPATLVLLGAGYGLSLLRRPARRPCSAKSQSHFHHWWRA